MKLNPQFSEMLSSNHPSVTLDDVFTEEECLRIIQIGKSAGLSDSALVSTVINESIRKSKNSFLVPTEETRWIFEKIMGALEWANEFYFQFDLYGFANMQYTEYGPDNNYYDWHCDMEFGQADVPVNMVMQNRKLSASVILCNRDEYIGGDLYVVRDHENNPVNITPQSIGSMVVFPSYIDHKVSPVTEGTRSSLVVWVLGPKFK